MADASFAAAERAAWRLRLPAVREAVLCTGIAAAAASLLVWLAPPGGDRGPIYTSARLPPTVHA
jgi:hypothetical protein